MSPVCFLSQYSLKRKTWGKWTVRRRRRPISMMVQAVSRTKKKERRRNSDRPSSMSLSEEGPSVSCIDAHTGNRSSFFEGSYGRKSERRTYAHSRQGFTRQMGAPILALGCRSPASSPRLGGCRKRALVEVEGNNFPAHQMHRVKLVWGTPGEVAHIPARAFKSNNASPPK